MRGTGVGIKQCCRFPAKRGRLETRRSSCTPIASPTTSKPRIPSFGRTCPFSARTWCDTTLVRGGRVFFRFLEKKSVREQFYPRGMDTFHKSYSVLPVMHNLVGLLFQTFLPSRTAHVDVRQPRSRPTPRDDVVLRLCRRGEESEDDARPRELGDWPLPAPHRRRGFRIRRGGGRGSEHSASIHIPHISLFKAARL